VIHFSQRGRNQLHETAGNSNFGWVHCLTANQLINTPQFLHQSCSKLNANNQIAKITAFAEDTTKHLSQTRPSSVQILSTPKHLTAILYLQLPKSIMKLQSTRICKPRTPLRQQSDSHKIIPGMLQHASSMAAEVLILSLATRRRSSRLQSSQHILGRYQSPLGQRPADPLTSQLAGATSCTCVPSSSPVEVSAPVPSGAQFQG
jgi:hypothetical protein